MSAIHWDSFFFLFFALVTCVFAVAVVVSNNIVRMAAYLVASLCGVAGLFFLSGASSWGPCNSCSMSAARSCCWSSASCSRQGDRSCRCGAAAGNGSWPCWRADRCWPCSCRPWARFGRSRNQPRPPWRPPQTNPTTTQLGAGLVGVRTDNVGRVSRATRKNRTLTSATSCRLKSSPSISWSSSWEPRSWHGPSAASGPENRDWS